MQILPTIHALAVPYSVPTKTAHQHDCRMVFLPGSFANYIKGGHLPEIWLCHDETRKVPVKRLELTETPFGVICDLVPEESPVTNELLRAQWRGELRQMSVGVDMAVTQFQLSGNERVLTVHEVELLREISFTSRPGYKETASTPSAWLPVSSEVGEIAARAFKWRARGGFGV